MVEQDPEGTLRMSWPGWDGDQLIGHGCLNFGL